MGGPNSKPCTFCHILSESYDNAGSAVIYQDDLCFAFHDLSKSGAREHILICPKRHIDNVNVLDRTHVSLLKHMKEVGKKLLEDIDANAEKRYGFHKPPFYAINHLHMHCALGPFQSKLHDKLTFGAILRTVEDQIQMIENKEPQNK